MLKHINKLVRSCFCFSNKFLRDANLFILYIVNFPPGKGPIPNNPHVKPESLPDMTDAVSLHSVSVLVEDKKLLASFHNRFSLIDNDGTVNLAYFKGKLWFSKDDISAILHFCQDKKQNLASIRNLITENNQMYQELNSLACILEDTVPHTVAHPQILEIILLLSQ
jgi:hypothetical protein